MPEETEIRCPGDAIGVVQVGDGWWEFEYPRLTMSVYDEYQDAMEVWRPGQVSIAESRFRELISRFPEFIDAYHHLALLLEETGRAEDAFQVWAKVVAFGLSCLPEEFEIGRDLIPWICLDNRPFLRAYHALGLVYRDRRMIGEALEVFEGNLALNPNDNLGARALAIECNFSLKRPDCVLEICDRYPEDGMEAVIYGRVLALFQLRRRDEAEAALRDAAGFLPLVAEYLVRKRHQRPKHLNPDRVIVGGLDQAYYYWKDHGRYWKKTPGALEFVKECLQALQTGSLLESYVNTSASTDGVILDKAVSAFGDLIGRFGYHAVASGAEVYLQPYVYLSLHLVQMLAAGWRNVDFDQLAAVSGVSALFAYQRGEFMPKYAYLHLGPDQRITEATGFGYEWLDFQDVAGAWKLIRESIDSGRSLKGWHWENILFAGYREASQTQDREVFAMSDGPDTSAAWWTWDELTEYVDQIGGIGHQQFGRHTGSLIPKSAKSVAARVMQDLVACSTEPPEEVRGKYPDAVFGLAGIEAYAADWERTDVIGDWVACHDINPQWTARNCTSVYLKRVVEDAVFPEEVNAHLLAAAVHYRAAYECWEVYYDLLGHNVAEEMRKMKARRQSGAATVRAWLEHERTAIGAIKQALLLLDQA